MTTISRHWRTLNHAIELDPSYTWPYIQRGETYRLRKYSPQALADLNHAIELDPSSAQAYNFRSRIYEDLQDYQRALQDCNSAMVFDSQYASPYHRRGYIYLWQRNLSQAKVDFISGWQLDPTDMNDGWMIEFVNMCQMKPSLAMVERLETLAAGDPESHYAYICKGVSHFLYGEFEIAIKDLEQASKQNPDSEDAYFWISIAYASLGQDNEAKAALDRALELGLPPILLTPLRWFEHDRPKFYTKYAKSLLIGFDLTPE